MVLPIPELRRSWEEKGQSRKAATGDRKEKVSQRGQRSEEVQEGQRAGAAGALA